MKTLSYNMITEQINDNVYNYLFIVKKYAGLFKDGMMYGKNWQRKNEDRNKKIWKLKNE